MQDIYKTFEFDRIKDAILQYSKTELAKIYINDLKMFEEEESLKYAKELLDEVSSINLRFGPFPISSSVNALNLISMAKKTAMLSERDLFLLSNDIDTISFIQKYLNKIDVSYPLVNQIKDQFFDLSNLYHEIRRTITTSYTVYDNATSELKNIRHSLKKAEEELMNKTSTLAYHYSAYTDDNNPTIRDGHFVLPVKTAYKHKVSGIVYDVSSTGNTTFIEPLEIVELNNKITQLKVEENKEVRKILRQLTNLVLLQENEIITNNKLIAVLDFNAAKASYGNQIHGVLAEYSPSSYIELIKARHPLIDASKVVPNDYSLTEEKRIIIISGPNAGGKTVSLKTVGLLVLMNQCGLMIPALKGKLSFFKSIYIDIGDNQSLSDNLSTFSAHMRQIGEIATLVKGKDLVLLDELGTGTDPKEGEAIAMAVTERLLNKHCLAMISSHFNALKEFAFLNKNVENSSMIFDEEKLLPTYLFKQGIPGKSYGLDVAIRFGIDSDLIQQARLYLNKSKESSSSELILILQAKMKDLAIKEEEERKKIIELKNLEKELSNREALLENRKAMLLQEVKKEKEQYIEKSIQEVEKIIKQLSANQDLKLHEAVEIKKQIEDLKDINQETIYDENIQTGDYVSYPLLNITGKVTSISSNKAVINSNDGLTYKIDCNKLTKIAPIKTSKKINKNNYEFKMNTNVGLELNLIGLRRDEAEAKLIKYIDECRMKNLKNVRIIHGYGSGILRKMVHEYLSKQKDLTFRLGDAYEGGSGATAVSFKNEFKD